jgi:putative transposase
MLKAYKYRIFPNEEQKVFLTNIFGQVRFIYNLALETKQMAYNGNKKSLTCVDLTNQIIELKKECAWLKESPSQALQMALRNLDNAYTNFFKGKGFPKYKNKYSKQSFQLPQGVYLSEDNKQIFIPKLKYVAIDLHRKFEGKIKTTTISKTTTDKYFVSLLIETNKNKPNKKPIDNATSVGLDMGIKDFVITSNNRKYKNHGFLKQSLRQLRIEQRSLVRKQKGSNRYDKQKRKLALLHEHIANQRKDYLHKISKELIDAYDTICLEDLAVSNMVQNHNLARSISDVSWSMFKSMLEYKTEWYGKNIRTIGRFEPSSKACSDCGAINKELRLSDREWVCKECGSVHDRDVNAAINIKNFGLRNKPNITQSKSMDYACGVEATSFRL